MSEIHVGNQRAASGTGDAITASKADAGPVSDKGVAVTVMPDAQSKLPVQQAPKRPRAAAKKIVASVPKKRAPASAQKRGQVTKSTDAAKAPGQSAPKGVISTKDKGAAAEEAVKASKSSKEPSRPLKKPAVTTSEKPEPVHAKAKAKSKGKPAAAPAKVKMVRDSFTMPRDEFELIDQIKARALNFRRPTKKSEILRAGLSALMALSDRQLQAALNALKPIKAGRPKKDD